jgi:hypothetical protein
MKGKLVIILLIAFITGCEKDNPGPVITTGEKKVFEGNGLFLMNEGNFTWGNGSLSFFSTDSGKIYNNIFFASNKRTPGDVPFSMLLRGDTAFLIVNNSGKMEVIDSRSIRSIKTITGLKSPRYIVEVAEGKGYISSLYSDTVAIFDFHTTSVSGHINIGCNSEQILVADSKAYIASWSGGSRIAVVDINNDLLLKFIEVGKEPESMVRDQNGNIWVLCSGGYTGDDKPTLFCLNPLTDQIITEFEFDNSSYPTNLKISAAGDTLYFIDRGVFKMSVNDAALPLIPFITEDGKLFYRMEPDVRNSEIFVTDAGDYQHSGHLLRYSSNGKIIDSHVAGIIPGMMVKRRK